MRSGLAWFLLVLLAMLLILSGFQGSLGRLVAVVFVPGQLEIGDSGESGSQGVSTI